MLSQKHAIDFPCEEISLFARPPAVAKALAGRRSILPTLSVRSLKGVGGSACATVFVNNISSPY